MPTQFANDYTWYYNVFGNVATIGNNTSSANATTAGTNMIGAVVIPSTLGGYPVTAIGIYAFKSCSFSSITIPNSVTTINNYAFQLCSNLPSLTIPNLVTFIGDNAFENCNNLTSINIPNSVTFIGEGALGSCSKLSSINIPNSVTTIALGTFSKCTLLSSVKIGKSVTTIGQYAFELCSNLKSINIPDSVTSIGNYAFNLTSENLTVMMKTKTIGGTTYNSPTAPGPDIWFFWNASTTLVLPPTMTITSTTVTTGSTTNNASIALTFTSSRSTSDFVVGGISLTNGSLNSSFTAVSATVYTAIFSPTGQGACTIVVGSGAYTDASGNINSASDTFNWTYDSFPPNMTITSTTSGVTSGSTTNNATIALTFTSSEATTNFLVGGISLTNGSLNSSFTAVSATVYTAIFTPSGQGACTINIAAGVYTDAVGNNNTAATTFNWTYDSVPPTMTITSTTSGVTSGSTTNNAFISLTFTSTKTTTNFVVGDISVTNGTLSNFAGSGTIYNATFTPTRPGACTINVASGTYTDALGNNNTAATQFNWTTTAWNIDASANHIIKSYVKDFIDVSGSVVLRENSNLYISGAAETAGSLSLNRLVVTADASFNRRIFVGGDVSMNGNVTVSGDLSMNGTVTKCAFNNSSIPKSAFSGTVPDGADYTTPKIVYDQTFQANDDVSMNGPIVAANNVKVSGNIVFGDGTVMNTYDNNVLTTNPTVFKTSTFTSLDICGNLVAGSYATSSDYRIKTNIVELDETYTVDKLRPVKYYQTQINREKYGLIAHELQEHYPDLVIGTKDGSELQRVNYTGLIAILINDIKRLKQNLAELETDVAVGR